MIVSCDQLGETLRAAPSYTTPGKKKKNDGQYDKARKIDVFGRELGRGDLSLTFLAILLKKYSICREYRLKVTVSRGLVHLLKRFYRSTALHKHCNIERLPFLGNFP